MSGSIGDRLEQVRRAAGIDTVLEFVERLKAAGEVVTYSTATRYHRDREPSVDYLAAVVRTFGVPAHWLLVGEEQPDNECRGCWSREQRIRAAIAALDP